MAMALKDAIARSGAVLFVTPEYTRSIPGALRPSTGSWQWSWPDRRAEATVRFGVRLDGQRQASTTGRRR
jgi:hypothetical protein